jgi:hypothetical protein
MIGAMDKSNIISKKEIIDLVKHPFDFFDLYNKTVDEGEKLNATLLKKVKNKTDSALAYPADCQNSALLK